MAKNPETLQMELAVEEMAASNRRQFWTKQDVVRTFIKRNPEKQKELRELAELDRRTQAELAPGREPLGRVHQDRELARLHQVAGRVMREWREEEYHLHRRFGAFQATPANSKKEWRWFEVRYSLTSFLRMWRDLKEAHRIRVGLTISETDVILDLARQRGAETVNGIYREAMAKIADGRKIA